jgi:hypothetical protein
VQRVWDGEQRNADRILVGKPVRKGLHGIRRRWEESIKIEPKQIMSTGGDRRMEIPPCPS